MQIAKNVPSGVKVRGLQRPQFALRTQNFKIFTFLRDPCVQTVRPRGSLMALFCITEGCLVNAQIFLSDPCNIAPGAPGAPHPRKISPNFLKILRGRGPIFTFIMQEPQDP